MEFEGEAVGKRKVKIGDVCEPPLKFEQANLRSSF
jgi:hypothetical protein